ncbi:MAG: preprotein translocase subunit SecY [Oscillospiraceae bacterium]
MFETFRNAWKIQDLRRKLLFTLFILVIYRLGVAITVPYLDPAILQSWMGDGQNFLNYMDMLSGGSFSNATIFALSITPYINASIIMQLLTYALPPLERLQKEGPEGRKKLNKITRLVSLAIGIFMSYAFYLTLKKAGALTYTGGFDGIFSAVIIIACFAAGASFIIWLGDQISDKGIGNGVSLILFASIVSRGPAALQTLIEYLKLAKDNHPEYYVYVPLIFVIFIAMIAFIILMNNAERRIPIQYAKRVVGRKQYGGQTTNIPIKVAMSGVLPIIFAMSLLQLPATLELFVKPKDGSFYAGFLKFFSTSSAPYAIMYFLLIIGFNYFYVSMQYNPIEIANNLRSNNGGIPGIRPGRPTSEFISRVLSKITLVGACFLGVIAIFPIFFQMGTKMNVAMGGTSILIVVGVALETVRTLESQMMMRHHKGFLE